MSGLLSTFPSRVSHSEVDKKLRMRTAHISLMKTFGINAYLLTDGLINSLSLFTSALHFSFSFIEPVLQADFLLSLPISKLRCTP
jgi:hypothetical protein